MNLSSDVENLYRATTVCMYDAVKIPFQAKIRNPHLVKRRLLKLTAFHNDFRLIGKSGQLSDPVDDSTLRGPFDVKEKNQLVFEIGIAKPPMSVSS